MEFPCWLGTLNPEAEAEDDQPRPQKIAVWLVVEKIQVLGKMVLLTPVIVETGSPSLWVGEEEIEPAADPLGRLENTKNCRQPWAGNLEQATCSAALPF
jgi:hypothetical protein